MRERHPYGNFIPPGAKGMLVGSFPIAKFTDPQRRYEIKKHEIDFFFGGERNLLWKILSEVYKLPLSSPKEIKKFLHDKRLAIGDVIVSCRRKKGRSSDGDLYDIEWNQDLLKHIHRHRIKTIYFTSQSVKNWFNRLFPESGDLTKIELISPSGQILRSLVQQEEFKKWLEQNPERKKHDYIVEDYRSKLSLIEAES